MGEGQSRQFMYTGNPDEALPKFLNDFKKGYSSRFGNNNLTTFINFRAVKVFDIYNECKQRNHFGIVFDDDFIIFVPKTSTISTHKQLYKEMKKRISN